MTEMQQQEKAFLERRIRVLEEALCDETTLTNVTAGGVGETVDREKIMRELNETRARYNALYGGATQVFGVVLH